MITSDARIDLRLNPDTKEPFNKATQMTGTSLSAFVISSTLDRAKKMIEDQKTLQLSDQDLFLNTLDEPSAANEALEHTAAAKSHH